MSIPQGDLTQALARATRNARSSTWAVVDGISTTEFTVALASNTGVVPDIDTTSATNLVGELAEFYILGGVAVAVNRTIDGISFDSVTKVLTVTLKTALPSVPQAGDEMVVYGTQTTVTASNDVTGWGGANLSAAAEAADITEAGTLAGVHDPTLGTQADAAVTDPDGSASVVALLKGWLSKFASSLAALVWDAAGEAASANENLFGASYSPPGPGRLAITIGNLSTGASSVASIVKTANSAPTGGSAGTRVFALNAGEALGAGDIFAFEIAVTANDSYNLQFATATTVDVTATFRPV